MSDSSDKLHRLADGYFSGLFTKDEVIGQSILILESPDYRALWEFVPTWVRSEIWAFLKPCDETTQLININESIFPHVIDPNLIALKNWLISEKGYE